MKIQQNNTYLTMDNSLDHQKEIEVIINAKYEDFEQSIWLNKQTAKQVIAHLKNLYSI